jgi:hypothetical protein
MFQVVWGQRAVNDLAVIWTKGDSTGATSHPGVGRNRRLAPRDRIPSHRLTNPLPRRPAQSAALGLTEVSCVALGGPGSFILFLFAGTPNRLVSG